MPNRLAVLGPSARRRLDFQERSAAVPRGAGGTSSFAAQDMNKKILPIILVLVIVVAAFAVYYFFLRPDPNENATPTQYEELEKTVYYTPGDYFVTNITGSQALTKTSVALALSEDETSFLETNNAVIRNAIVKVLISHPEEEMRAANSIDMLEAEMADSIRSATGIETLDRVLISDFVIQ